MKLADLNGQPCPIDASHGLVKYVLFRRVEERAMCPQLCEGASMLQAAEKKAAERGSVPSEGTPEGNGEPDSLTADEWLGPGTQKSPPQGNGGPERTGQSGGRALSASASMWPRSDERGILSASKDTDSPHETQLPPEPEYVKPVKTAKPQKDLLATVPAQDVQAEMDVLGALFLDPDRIGEVNLVPLDFYRPSNANIFAAMQQISREGLAIDAHTIEYELKKRGELEGVGGIGYIAELVALVPSALNLQSYVTIVRETAVKRRAASRAHRVIELATNGASTTEVMEEVQRLTLVGEVRPADESAEPPKALNLGELYSLVDEWDRQPWVWDGILPHASLSLLTGKSETGKSTIVYGLIYAVIRGLEFFGRQCQHGPVLYLAGDPVSEVVAGKTFKTMGLEPGADPIHVVPGALVGHPSGLQMLAAWVKDIKPALVVGDTLAATVAIDVDKYGQSYQVQQPLTAMARRSTAHFLMLHHSQKTAIDSYSVIDSALGSVGVAAVASTRMGTKMYRRAGKRFFTFEMSNLRIGTPIEGEHLVYKSEDGRIELGGLWNERAKEMDQELIRNALSRIPYGEGISERTLWNQVFPKPKWMAFKLALDAMVESGQAICRPRGKKGGGKEYLLASRIQVSTSDQKSDAFATPENEPGKMQKDYRRETLSSEVSTSDQKSGRKSTDKNGIPWD